MGELTKNQGLARLLVNNDDNPFTKPVENTHKLIIPDASSSKIFPYPFDPEATVNDGSFIRVYYNDGSFNSNETIAESQLHIDIIVAKKLWLINNGDESMIRPYEIMGHVVSMLGKRSLNTTIKLNFEGYMHMYINSKFDAVRLFANYMSVEA